MHEETLTDLKDAGAPQDVIDRVEEHSRLYGAHLNAAVHAEDKGEITMSEVLYDAADIADARGFALWTEWVVR